MELGLPYTALIESLENKVERGLFTAWACAHQNGIVSAFYADEAAPEDWFLDQTSENQNLAHYWLPPFDLASLTKPLLANAWLRHKFGADPVLWCRTPLATLIEPRSDEGVLLKSWFEALPHLTLARVINHTSGIRPWTWFGRSLWENTNQSKTNQSTKLTRRPRDLKEDESGQFAKRAQHELTSYILQLTAHEAKSESATTKYSDLNYYLLARVIENLAMVNFPGWDGVMAEINQRWQTGFWHASLEPEQSLQAIPFYPYLHSQVVAHLYEQRKLNQHVGEFGSVHDTNANILATEFRASNKTAPIVSSHSGIFGQIFDLIKTVPFFISTQSDFSSLSIPENKSQERFHWGFDTPSHELSSAGINHWSRVNQSKIFGHLGYTGTSLWMADDGQYHILLTNRTAERKVIGSSKVPRVLIFHKESNTAPECWICWTHPQTQLSGQNTWQPCAWRDAYSLCVEHTRSTTRYWDRNILRCPPDLLSLRRSTGQLLWAH